MFTPCGRSGRFRLRDIIHQKDGRPQWKNCQPCHQRRWRVDLLTAIFANQASTTGDDVFGSFK